MAKASAAPILLGAGAVALSKKKPSAKKKNGGKANGIVSSGKVERTGIFYTASKAYSQGG